MGEAPLTKLANADLSLIIERSGVVREGLAETHDLGEAIELLIRQGCLMEAARCFAHALPRREAVWWAAMCALHTAPADLKEPDRLAREAGEAWVRQQSEEARRQAMAQAERTGFQSPEAWVGIAAFWSGPSIAPAGLPPVPPAPHLTGTAVAGAVALAAVRNAPERQAARLMRFLDSAHAIAGGGAGRLEPEAAPPSQDHAARG